MSVPAVEQSDVQIRVRTFSAVKRGNAPHEYEDAFSAREGGEGMSCWRVAVADGATETSFSGAWAGLLVQAYAEGADTPGALRLALPWLEGRWRDGVDAGRLPWYADEKLAHGAFSSLLGLTVRAHKRQWKAMAVGDSILVQRRGESLLARFPIGCAADFNSRPQLLATRAEANRPLDERVGRLLGGWEEGDIFYLMTDALGAWFLGTWEGGARPWERLDAVDEGTFPDLIEELRADTLRNDDVTLVRIGVGEAGEPAG